MHARTVFAKSWFGGRASVYYADTTAHGPVDGGRAYGTDINALVRFGGDSSFGYVFAGPGYARATFTRRCQSRPCRPGTEVAGATPPLVPTPFEATLCRAQGTPAGYSISMRSNASSRCSTASSFPAALRPE